MFSSEKKLKIFPYSINTLNYLIIILLNTLLYYHTVFFPFLNGWDDNIYVLQNETALSFSFSNILYWFKTPCLGHYLPLTMFSYMFDHLIWGINPMGYHLQNIFWHIIATIALYKCFGCFKIPPFLSLTLSLIFSCHPQRVESVVWISQRKDVMCAALYFWSVLFYMKSRAENKFSYASLFLFIGALLSKPMALSLPFVILLYEFYLLRSFNFKHYLKRFWPYFIIDIILLPLIIFSFNRDQDLPVILHLNPGWQILTLIHNFYWYIEKTLLPFDICPLYPKIAFYPATIFKLSFFYLLLAIFSIWTLKKITALFTFSILPVVLCYAVSLLPVSGLISFGGYDYADRYSYIPSSFIMLLIGILSAPLFKNDSLNLNNEIFQFRIAFFRRTVLFSVFLYFIFLFSINYLYSYSWQSAYTLFQTVSFHNPPNPLSFSVLAEIELNNKNYDKVLEYADILEKQSGKELPSEFITGNKVNAKYLKACVYYRTNQKEKALALLESIKPYYSRTISNSLKTDYRKMLPIMADCYLERGQIEKSLNCYRELIQVSGGFDLFFYKGLVNYFSGNYEAAVENFQEALKLKPDDKRALSNLNESLKKYYGN